MPPEVVAQIEQFRAQVDALDQGALVRMAATWADATRELEDQYLLLAQEVTDQAAQGIPVSIWKVQRLQRYQDLLRQIDAKQRALAPVLVDQMTTAQEVMARLGLEHSQLVLDFLAPGITGQFDRLPYSAVANMVGNTAGGPLERLLRQSWADNAGAVGQALVRGTALGWHPTKTAAAMRQAQNMNLSRAIRIARTETNRVYRSATQMQYKAGGMPGYRRHADKSPRTCVACLMQDGKWYPIDVAFEEHVNGRCAMIPSRSASEPVTWETGEQWFMRQDAQTQRAMLGPGRYSAWQLGQFGLRDVPVLVENDTWGGAWQMRSLQELTA